MSREGNPVQVSASVPEEVNGTLGIPVSPLNLVLSEEEKNENVEEKKHLTEVQMESIQNYANAWLENYYNGVISGKGLTQSKDDSTEVEVRNIIATLCEKSEEYGAMRYKEGAEIFFTALMHFCEKKDNKEPLSKFLSTLREDLFSKPSNIFNEMGIYEQLISYSKATTLPELQNLFDDSFIESFIITLVYPSTESVKDLNEKIDSLNTTQKIEVLKIFLNINKQSKYGNSGDFISKKIIKAVKGFSDEKNVLVSLVSDEVVKRISTGFQDVYQVGKKDNERHKVTDKTKENFVIHREWKGYELLPIASDAFGVFDNTLDLQGIGFSRNTLQSGIENRKKQTNYTAHNLDIKYLEDISDSKIAELLELVEYYASHMESIEERDVQDAEHAHEYLKKLLHEINSIKVEHLSIEEKGKEKDDRVAKEKKASSIEYMQKTIDVVNNFVETSHDKEFYSYFSTYVQKIKEYIAQDNVDMAMGATDQLSSMYFDATDPKFFPNIPSGERLTLHRLKKEMLEKHKQYAVVAEIEYQSTFSAYLKMVKSFEENVKKQILEPSFRVFLETYIHNTGEDVPCIKPVLEIKNIDQAGLFENEWQYMDNYSEEDKELFLNALFDPLLREKIANDLHIEWTEIPLRFQIDFLKYLLGADKSNYDNLAEATKSYVRDKGVFFRTFLAMRRGGQSLGDEIVNFTLRNPKESQQVFTYFGELLESADRAEELAESISHCKLDECRDVTEKIRENLLNRAQKDLERALRTDDVSQVEELVKNYVVHAKEYVALVQEVGAGNIESKEPSELEDNEKEEMRVLLRANFEEMYPSDEDTVFREKVQETLEKSFSNQNTVFKIVRDKEKIVCFSRFDTLTDHEGGSVTYAGSFNVRSEYNGLGGVMHDENIKEQLKNGRSVLAHCDPAQPISKKYIESGFVGVGLYPIVNKDCFEIWRTNDTVSSYESKQVKKEELLTFVGDEKAPYVVREQKENEQYSEFEEGKVLTRFFVHEGKTYVVFEKAVKPVKKKESSQEV